MCKSPSAVNARPMQSARSPIPDPTIATIARLRSSATSPSMRRSTTSSSRWLASSSVTDTDTSDVDTTSTEALCQQHSWRAHLDHRDVTLGSYGRHCATRRVESDPRSRLPRVASIVDVNRYPQPDRGRDCVWMENLRTKRRQFRRLVEPDLWNQSRATDDSRIRCQHAIYICPDLDVFRAERSTEQ